MARSMESLPADAQDFSRPTPRARLKAALLVAARCAGLFALARRLTRHKLRILGYHGIWFSDGHYGNRIFMKPESFRRRMAWLARSGYPVLPLGAAVDGLYAASLPTCPVCITIDDGWYGTYRHMAPVLKELGLPATVYVCTGEVDTQLPVFDIAIRVLLRAAQADEVTLAADVLGEEVRLDLTSPARREAAADIVLDRMAGWPAAEKDRACRAIDRALGGAYGRLVEDRQLQNMSYDEIRDLADEGIDIQLHTHSHRLAADEPEGVEPEILANRERLGRVVSRPLDQFCYPSGVYSRSMAPHLQRLGIRSATTVAAGLNDRRTPRYELARILDGEYVPQIEIEAELAGLLELKRMAAGFVRRLRSGGQPGLTAAEPAAAPSSPR